MRLMANLFHGYPHERAAKATATYLSSYQFLRYVSIKETCILITKEHCMRKFVYYFKTFSPI